ncbi:MAG: AAA family ATPase, partial [Oscillospiraceae bacterium]
MICSRCKKRPAVVFVQRSDGKEIKNEGYCLSCARALNIPQVEQMMKQFGINDENLEMLEEKFNAAMGDESIDEMMKDIDPDEVKELISQMTGGDGDGDEGNDEDDFTPGGSPSMPLVFGDNTQGDSKGKKQNKNDKKPPARKFLDSYCENLTAKAKNGSLDKIIGRDREIYRTVQILCRRQKNNPCLIGEAGVGKTAIAEGIAIKIAEGNVPSRLKDKEIYLLDLTSLVAGTQFRGQFESRVKGLISEVKALGNIILFIYE